MRIVNKSAGGLRGDSSAAAMSGNSTAVLTQTVALRKRDGTVTVSELIDAYMSQYAGRDPTRPQRLRFWQAKLGSLSLTDLIDDDHIHIAVEHLATQRGRYFSGYDADGQGIYKAKRKAALASDAQSLPSRAKRRLLVGLRKRIAPRGWTNPCRYIEHRAENNEVVRYLSEPERRSLLAECKSSKWPKLYLLVTLALTTGARLGELQALRWADVNFDRAEAAIPRSKKMAIRRSFHWFLL